MTLRRYNLLYVNHLVYREPWLMCVPVKTAIETSILFLCQDILWFTNYAETNVEYALPLGVVESKRRCCAFGPVVERASNCTIHAQHIHWCSSWEELTDHRQTRLLTWDSGVALLHCPCPSHTWQHGRENDYLAGLLLTRLRSQKEICSNTLKSYII